VFLVIYIYLCALGTLYYYIYFSYFVYLFVIFHDKIDFFATNKLAQSIVPHFELSLYLKGKSHVLQLHLFV